MATSQIIPASGSNPRAAAKALVESIPLREVFQDPELKDAFLSELFLTIAKEDMREDRRKRQQEGIAAAKSRGVQFGAKRKKMPDGFEAMARQWNAGEISSRDAGKLLGIPHQRFLNHVKEYCAQESGKPED